MEFYMAGSTSGLGRRPLKAESGVQFPYELLMEELLSV